MRTAIVLICAILVLPVSTPSYVNKKLGSINMIWSSNTVVVRPSSISFAPGSVFRTALQDVFMDFAYENPSKAWFTWRYESGVRLNNDQNEIWFSTSQDILGGAPAVCLTWYNLWGQRIAETDVVFDANESWTTSEHKSQVLSYQGTRRPFQAAAFHELGHALGLMHEGDTYNIMGADWTHAHTNGSTVKSYLGEDAARGLMDLYGAKPASSATTDVAVAHWKRTGQSGEYSSHGRNRILDSSGRPLSSYMDQNEPRYRVNKGQTVKLEVTWENLGPTVQRPTVGFYVSTNDYISTWDRLIRSATIFVAPNTVSTNRWAVTIPADLVSNRDYSLGVIIDHGNTIAEVNETNNATYTGIRVR